MSNLIPIIDTTEGAPAQEQDLYVSREKIYVRKITGVFQRIRKYSLSLLMLMYFSFAWIQIDGQPFILFDLAERKFHLFGTVFWPQDFALLALALIICAFGLFFITALFGRVWCGYTCPQTAWSLMFIWLEEFFEGSRNQRIKLDKSSLTTKKFIRKLAKHTSWVLLALATAITFVGYFYPIRELSSELLSLSLSSSWLTIWIAFFTLATYINAGWLREQVCIYMCPYARFQSVMYNENTMLVAYDEKRGEPRGSRSRSKADHGLGDCVDCQLCVQVCPVGIDIRDGLQYECIGCALCIDACNTVMAKLDTPKGLIRYASEKELNSGQSSRPWDWRALGYGVSLALSIAAFFYLLAERPPVELSASRDRGALFYQTGMGMIQNAYTLDIVNKSKQAAEFKIDVSGPFEILLSQSRIRVGAGQLQTIPLSLETSPDYIETSKTEVVFDVRYVATGDLAASASSTFFGPMRLR